MPCGNIIQTTHTAAGPVTYSRGEARDQPGKGLKRRRRSREAGQLGKLMAQSADGIFRKAALDRLSSPEQLDQVAGLTSPAGWIALAALGALVLAGLVWSVVGVVPSWVSGRGILVSQGGHLFDAKAPSDGSLVTLAAIGAKVHKGDLLATLDDTRLRQELQHAQDVEREKQNDRDKIEARYHDEIDLKQQNIEARKANVSSLVAEAQQRSAFYDKLLNDQQSYLSQGYLTPQSVQETRQSKGLADQQQREGRSELLQLDAEALDLKSHRDEELLRAEEAISEAHRRIDELNTQMAQGTKVLSPLDGVVTEVKASPGSLVAAGKALLSIEASGEGLELLLYIPPEYGKKVTPGMDVRIEPATVRKEEYGTLKGRVLSVSDFPMTAEGMLSALENQQLVNSFMEGGPPYEVRVILIADAGTSSGYQWSSGSGPPLRLSSGTTATAEITVRQQAPISFLFPASRSLSGAAQ
jgi:HlyD family secretion protein